MRIAWVLGWAVPPSWFESLAREIFPHDEHVLIPSSSTWMQHLTSGGPWDAIAGHSLGTLLMLQETEAINRLTTRVALLAPVFAFSREDNLGGKIARTQVKFLKRWLKTDRDAALRDFYQRAGLDCTASSMTDPLEQLQWGLDRLAEDQVNAPWPKNWRGYVGADDVLLDAAALKQITGLITCVAGATHDPKELMRAWSRD